LNHLKLESVLLQRIIDAQRNDEGMKHIHKKIEAGKANCFRKDTREKRINDQKMTTTYNMWLL
jgi:hypothetical protein